MTRWDAGVQWLTAEQQQMWRAYMRVQLRLNYEMNGQLLTGHALSLGDYDVLVALSNAEKGRLQLSSLAATISWELSRLSHHLTRMERRDLVERQPSTVDGRARDAVLTAAGWAKLKAAAPGHVDAVRRLFFDGIEPALLPRLTQAFEQAYAHLVAHGSLPAGGAGSAGSSNGALGESAAPGPARPADQSL
jgi:DNA-binding MarR family transcriptional regulator